MYEIKLNKKAQNLTLKQVERSLKLYQTGRRGTPGVVQSIVAGTNVNVDSTDPANPVVSSSGGGSGNPAPPVKSVQFNDENFGGSENFVYDRDKKSLEITDDGEAEHPAFYSAKVEDFWQQEIWSGQFSDERWSIIEGNWTLNTWDAEFDDENNWGQLLLDLSDLLEPGKKYYVSYYGQFNQSMDESQWVEFMLGGQWFGYEYFDPENPNAQEWVDPEGFIEIDPEEDDLTLKVYTYSYFQIYGIYIQEVSNQKAITVYSNDDGELFSIDARGHIEELNVGELEVTDELYVEGEAYFDGEVEFNDLVALDDNPLQLRNTGDSNHEIVHSDEDGIDGVLIKGNQGFAFGVNASGNYRQVGRYNGDSEEGYWTFAQERLTNVADPEDSQDVATKSYVDTGLGSVPTYYEGHYASGNTVYYSQKYEFVYAFNPSMSSLSSLTLDLTSGINENILAGGGLWSEAGIDSFNFTLPDGYTAVNEPGSLSAGQSLHFAVDYTNDRVVFY